MLELRQALYARLGVVADVVEQYPTWDGQHGRVEWVRASIGPRANDELFDRYQPRELVERFFGREQRPRRASEAQWYNHRFACCAVVYELWLLGQQPRRNPGALLHMLLSDELQGSRPHGVVADVLAACSEPGSELRNAPPPAR